MTEIGRLTRRLLVVAGFAFLTAGTAGAQTTTSDAAFDKLVADAKAEGTLLLYTSGQEARMAKWVQPFIDKYGIKVERYRGPSNPLMQRFGQEMQVGRSRADLVLVDLEALQDANAKGWLDKYRVRSAAKFTDKNVDTNIYVPLWLSTGGVAYNVKVTTAEEQAMLKADGYGALLDPRFKGRIAMVRPTAGNLQMANYANFAINQPDRYGWAYLEKLAKNKPAIIDDAPPLVDSVVAGEYAVTLDGYPGQYGTAFMAGAPVRFSIPDTVIGLVWAISASAKAPHPNAARLFLEWASSLEAQDSIASIYFGPSLHSDWKDTRTITQEPWYTSPKTIWTGWMSAKELQGEERKKFYDRWSKTFE